MKPLLSLVKNGLIIALCCGVLYAGTPTSNILPNIIASVNAYPFLQAECKTFTTESGDFWATPSADQYTTANYYFSRYGISNNYSARIEYQGNWEKTFKIVNNNYYASTPSGDYYVMSLDELLSSTLLPGFETYIFNRLSVVTLNQTITGNTIITASYTVSADFKTAVIFVSQNNIEKIQFYNEAGGLIRTMLFYYRQAQGLLYLNRCALVYDGVNSITIKEYTAISDNSINNLEYSLTPASPISDDSPLPNPDPWLPGNQAKYEEGGKLTPFASYGAAGENIPGQSGALQLGYTDLVLPGKNGLDVNIRRTYLSQQYKSNPKPTSFSEDPFNVRYSARKFLDEYSLVMPDSWGGWMGKGWQLSIGGELYVNEINTFLISGPYLGPVEVSQIKSVTVRNYTMQTADGYRADFGTEFESELKGSTAMGAITQVGIATLGIANICMARNNGVMDADKMFEMRRYLEQTGKLETAPSILMSRDKRAKMKIKIINDDHYVVYLPDGRKYHFTQKIFNKEAKWSKDAYLTTILGVSRGFLGYQFRSRIYYLTKIEDVNNNFIDINYEPLFAEQTDNGGYKAMDYNSKVDTQKFVNYALTLYSGMPENESFDAAKFTASMKSYLDDLSNAHTLSTLAFDKEVRENLTLSDFASSSLISAIIGVLISALAKIIGAIPPGPAGLFMREILSLVISLLFSINTDDATMAYKAKYEVSGWRPYRIVDTLGRNIDLEYRSGDDPNTIRDSQLSKIKYKGPNGEDNEIVYTYDGNDLLVRVDYPAGNPVRYEYVYKDAGLNDPDIADKGWLLSKVQHPSGFSSEYNYRWYDPYADVNSFGSSLLSAEQRKRFCYYIVDQKKWSGPGAENRNWNYSYKRGQTYQLYPDDKSGLSKRWNFGEHHVVDPLGLDTQIDYIIGQVEAVYFPTLNAGTMWETHHQIRNEYDLFGSYQLKRQLIIRKTNLIEKNYDYDEYGQLIRETNHGMIDSTDATDTRITNFVYNNSLHDNNSDPNVYNLVAEQWLEEPSKNPGVKYQHTVRDYNGLGQVVSQRRYYTDTLYIEDKYEYDSFGNPIKYWDPNNNLLETSYQYDAYPQETKRVADGKTFKTVKTYSPYTGALLSATDENNYTISNAYDRLGRKIQETHSDPAGTFVRTDYLDSQYRTEVTDRKNRKTVYGYNPFGELKNITDPLNNTTTYLTDRLGRLQTIRLADGREYTYAYDEIGRPIRITYPDGSFARKAYEDAVNSILVWDENDHGMEYWYDAYGNLTKVVRGDIQEAGTIHYEYDGNNALTKIITPLDYEITFQNDLLGRRLKKIQPDNTFETFAYDNNSNLTLHTNYENKPISFTYDGLNRPKTETYQDSQFNVVYNYDNGTYGLGKLTGVTDKSGSAQFQYNQLGLMTDEIKNLNEQAYETKYNYDNTGLLTSLEYPQVNGNKLKVIYTYDELDRLKALSLQENLNQPKTLVTNTYDNTGRLIGRVYGNGLTETYTYDSKDRLTSQLCQTSTGNQVFTYTYKYDPAGNIIQREISDANVQRRRDSYQYDYINQLKYVDVPGDKDLVFDYDRQFNRLYMMHGFGVITYNYNQAMNYLLDWREDADNDGKYEIKAAYAYDKQGNPKYKEYWDVSRNVLAAKETYAWNDRDELTGVTGRITENYVYDYRGLRASKNAPSPGPFPAGGAGEFRYLYLQNNQPAFKYNVSENRYDVFIYEGSRRVMRVRIDNMGAVNKDYFINDYLGSPVAVIAEDQSIKYQNYQDPWGNMEMSIGVPTANPEFKYTDKEFDEDSDLYYFQARYYDPIGGRFLGRDRVGIDTNPEKYFQVNQFQFCFNNPVANVDRNGLETMAVNGIGGDTLTDFGGRINATNYQVAYGSWPKGIIGTFMLDVLSVPLFDPGHLEAQNKGYNNIMSNYNASRENGNFNNVVVHSGGGMASFFPIFFANLNGYHVDNLVTNASPMFIGPKWLLRMQGTKVTSYYFASDPVSWMAAGMDLITFDWENVFNNKNWFSNGAFLFGGHSLDQQKNSSGQTLEERVREVTGD